MCQWTIYKFRKKICVIISLPNLNNKIIELSKCLSVENQWK